MGRRALLVLLTLVVLVPALAHAQESEFRAPVAQFTLSPQRPAPGESVTASALPISKAFAPCDPLQRYEWDWDGDGEFEQNLTAAQAGFATERVFNDSGVYRVALRVTDKCGQQALAVVNLTVGTPPPGSRYDWSIVTDNAGAFWRGAVLVLWVSALTISVGLVLGLFVALARLSRFAPLRWVAAAYTEFLRGTPLLVQIFIVWLALPQIHSSLKFTPLVSGIIALVINTSAYQGEIIRAGIQAIPAGQHEAALAMGLTRWQTMRFVILPQALRLVIPPLTNEFIILIKDTSLLSAIGVLELMLTARILGSRYYSIVEPLIAVALIYFVMTYTLSLLLQHLERRLRIPGLGLPTGGAH